MEQPSTSNKDDIKFVPKIPISIFQQIAAAGIKLDAKTEKEMFAVPDKLMKADPNTGKAINSGAAKAVMNLVKTIGLKKGFKDYTYGDFKAEIIDDEIDRRARKAALNLLPKEDFKDLDGLPTAERESVILTSLKEVGGYPQNKLYIALKMEASNWAKHQLKWDKYFKKEINKKFQDFYKANFLRKFDNLDKSLLNRFEMFLKFGADLNFSIQGDETYPNLSNIINRIMNLELNPRFTRNPDLLFSEQLKLIKLLLKYGADPLLKDKVTEMAPLELAKSHLFTSHSMTINREGFIKYMTSSSEDLKIIKVFKDIIKLLEENVAEKNKNIPNQKIEKKDKPFIGII